MAYVPGYAADLFVSYAHRNNHDGWVTELKSRLAGSLADLSADVDLWFDADRLRTGDTFKQEIRDKLSDTMMMVSVVSPAYLQSEFCMPSVARSSGASSRIFVPSSRISPSVIL